MNATAAIATTSSTAVAAIVTAATGSGDEVDRHSHISDLMVGAHQIWNFIQGNLEKTYLYACVGILIGIVGLLSVANLLLRLKRKSTLGRSKSTLTRPTNATTKCKENKHVAKTPTGINRAPSGGWTFHEECSKLSGVPDNQQSFTSSPLLPWDVFVHVESPHESPLISSMPKPFSHGESPHQAYFLTTQQQVQQIFLTHSLPQHGPHGYLAASPQLTGTSLVRKSLVISGSGHNASSMRRGYHNNNNDDDKDEESVWVRRNQLRFENARGSSSSRKQQYCLPELQHAPISEV